MWEPTIKTMDRVEHNKPDLKVRLPNGKVFIIEVTVCRDDCVADRSEQKLQKYLPLRDDLLRQTREHTEILAIAVGATGAISKRTLEAIKTLNKNGIGLHPAKLQKAAAVETANLVRRTLCLH
jgi:hypothetical protein